MRYKIKENSILLDIVSNDDITEYNTLESLRDHLRERINETQIVYYNDAMDYLKENDPSLQNSVQLAFDCGFELTNINSELLATILYQEKLTTALETDIHTGQTLWQ